MFTGSSDLDIMILSYLEEGDLFTFCQVSHQALEEGSQDELWLIHLKRRYPWFQPKGGHYKRQFLQLANDGCILYHLEEIGLDLPKFQVASSLDEANVHQLDLDHFQEEECEYQLIVYYVQYRRPARKVLMYLTGDRRFLDRKMWDLYSVSYFNLPRTLVISMIYQEDDQNHLKPVPVVYPEMTDNLADYLRTRAEDTYRRFRKIESYLVIHPNSFQWTWWIYHPRLNNFQMTM